MNWLDYALICVVLFSALFGFLRGFVREILSLATWILAFVGTLRYAPLAAEKLKPVIVSQPVRMAGAYSLTFLGILLAGAIVTWMIVILVRSARLGPIDRTLGAGFGFLRGGFVVVAAVLVGLTTSLHEYPAWRSSRLVPELVPVAQALQTLIPDTWLAYLRPQAGAAKPGVK
jgi:membrane protein required for colicin V production